MFEQDPEEQFEKEDRQDSEGNEFHLRNVLFKRTRTSDRSR